LVLWEKSFLSCSRNPVEKCQILTLGHWLRFCSMKIFIVRIDEDFFSEVPYKKKSPDKIKLVNVLLIV
jgi:hypothetical protein